MLDLALKTKIEQRPSHKQQDTWPNQEMKSRKSFKKKKKKPLLCTFTYVVCSYRWAFNSESRLGFFLNEETGQVMFQRLLVSHRSCVWYSSFCLFISLLQEILCSFCLSSHKHSFVCSFFSGLQLCNHIFVFNYVLMSL